MAESPERVRIISIMTAEDFIAVDESGALPERYSLLVGLSRLLTGYEIAELVNEESVSFFNSGDLKWLGIADTTLDEFAQRRHEIQQLLDDVVAKAAVIQQAVETTDQAHADAQRDEYERRRTVMSDINMDLRREWQEDRSDPPPVGT
jgi:hypothetical protein